MQDFSDPDLAAMGVRRSRFPFAWGLVLLLLIGAGTFTAGYFLPLHKAHKELAEKYATLAKDQRTIADELARKEQELKQIDEERGKLKSAVAANDERTKGAEQRGSELTQKLDSALEKRVTQKSVSIAQADNVVSVRMPSSVVFGNNSVSVTRPGAQLLCEVAKALPKDSAVVIAAAHVASAEVPSSLTKTYKTAWDLTAAQAAAAALVLTKQCSLVAAQVTAAAHGNSQPIEGAAESDNARLELSVEL